MSRISSRKKNSSPVTKCSESPSTTEENDEKGVEDGAKDESQADQELQENGCHLGGWRGARCFLGGVFNTPKALYTALTDI